MATMQYLIRGFLVVAVMSVSALSSVAAGDTADSGRPLRIAVCQARLQFYRDEAAFARHVEGLVHRAIEEKPGLIVFPEDIGISLVALGEYDMVSSAPTLQDAVRGMVERHLEAILPICTEQKVSFQRALWLVKADEIRDVYMRTFGAVAKKYRVHILAGSVPMTMEENPGEVFNTSCVFDPNGRMKIVARKVHPIELEGAGGLDFVAASLETYRVFHVRGVKVGCLICADGWDPVLAKKLVEDGARVLVQVSANPEPWTETSEAGWKESVSSRAQENGVSGVLCMGVGDLLGLPFQGRSEIVAPGADGEMNVLGQAATATEETVIAVTLNVE